MHVLFLASTLPRFKGDHQAAFVFEQARAWKRARPDDRVSILAPHDVGAATDEELEGVHIRRFVYVTPRKFQRLAYPAILPNLRRSPWLALQVPPFLLAELFAARQLARQHPVDLVYAHWVVPQGLVAYALNATMGIPFCLQNHSSDLSVLTKLGSPGQTVARTMIRAASAFFCVNSQQEAAVRALFPESETSTQRKIMSLPMGVSEDLDFDARDSAPVTDDSYEYDLGMLSRLSKKKGITHFLDAVEALRAQGQSVQAAIAGDGEDRHALEEPAKRAGVNLLGFVSGDAKQDFIRKTRVLLFPSVVSQGDVEGMPVALLEALLLGKVAIASRATNITMLPEWEKISKSVILLEDPRDTAEFKSALERALALDGAQRREISEHLRQTLARYRWDNLVETYIGHLGSADDRLPVAARV